MDNETFFALLNNHSDLNASVLNFTTICPLSTNDSSQFTLITELCSFVSFPMTTQSNWNIQNDDVDDSEKASGIISDAVTYFFESMNYFFLSGVISILGCIANIFNMIVFYRQGFSEPVNISLFGLAISDFGALITLIWMSVCFSPPIRDSHTVPFNSVKVQYLSAGWPHVCFARITSCITAFVTLERCLCVAQPWRVRRLLTAKRTTIVIVSIFVVLIGSVCPVYYAITLGKVFDEDKNRTLISIEYRPSGEKIENISFAINIVVQISALLVVIVCTIVLVYSVNRKSQWRKTTSASTENQLSQKDKRLVKVVTTVSVIFITCFLPTAINLILMLLISQYSIVGTYKNFFQVGWSFLNTIEAINSSVNIIVYYKINTRYRVELQRMTCCTCLNKQELPARNGSGKRYSVENDENSTGMETSQNGT